MKIGLLGKKLGMTRVYDGKGVVTTVTVIEAGGNTLLQKKTQENDGYTWDPLESTCRHASLSIL